VPNYNFYVIIKSKGFPSDTELTTTQQQLQQQQQQKHQQQYDTTTTATSAVCYNNINSSSSMAVTFKASDLRHLKNVSKNAFQTFLWIFKTSDLSLE